MMDRQQLTSILYDARGASIGLVLRTSDSHRLKHQLYAMRKELADPSLAELQIRTSPFPEGDLIIVNSTIDLRKGEAHAP